MLPKIRPYPKVVEGVLKQLREQYGQRPWSTSGIEAVLRRTAFHEAGHAVAAVHVWGPGWIEFATIAPTQHEQMTVPRVSGELNGFVRIRMLSSLRIACLKPYQRRDELIWYGTHAYAGVAAEYPPEDEPDLENLTKVNLDGTEDEEDRWDFVEEADFGHIWENSEKDRLDYADYARRLYLSRPVNHWHMPSWKRARRVVTAKWAAIEAVAAALLTHGRLSGKQIEAIVSQTEVQR